MPHCVHNELELSLDRWNECHWYLHQMEANYHEPEPFRYSCNSFLRSVKEVPQALMNDIQKHPNIRDKIQLNFQQVRDNELFRTLAKQRDFVVHHGALNLNSQGLIGTMEGPKIKIAFPFRVHPWERSADAYERYKEMCRSDEFLRGLGPDCDSTPALWRTWMIPQFPGRDLLDVAFDAWVLLGQLLSSTIEALGGEKLDLSMPCRHDTKQIQLKRFSQHEFFKSVHGIDLKEVERMWREQKASNPLDQP